MSKFQKKGKNMVNGFVASNAKYGKASSLGTCKAHNERENEVTKNAFPELLPENFSHRFNTFEALNNKMINAKNAAGLRARGFQKNANVMVENVLVLDRNIVNQLKLENPTGYKDQLKERAILLAELIRDKFGLEPMDISFHWDEGHYDADNVFQNNYHAHMMFFNFDFEKLNQPLRKMKRDDFSIFQDLTATVFEPLNFKRGISKKETGRKHLEKHEFLNQKAKEKAQALESLDNEIDDLKNRDDLLRQSIGEANVLYKKYSNAIQNQKAVFEAMKKEIQEHEAQKKSLENNILLLKRELASVKHEAEGLGGRIANVSIMHRKLEAHRKQFEEFLGSTPDVALAKRLKEAEELIERHGLGSKKEIDSFVDDFQKMMDNDPIFGKY